MTLHVTLVATKGAVSPALFNETNPVPITILTTLPTNLSEAPIFNSVNCVRRLPSGESVYKIFSPKEMTDEILGDFFIGATLDWVYRKAWKAYPKLDPTDTFGPLELYPDSKTAGFWYTSGIESFISTMETSALSGRNIAALIAQKFWKDVEV
jgi:prenylcysteine oxidase / farnesylcysteine lyase